MKLQEAVMCTLFWVCVAMIGLKAADTTAVCTGDVTLAQLLMERLWPR